MSRKPPLEWIKRAGTSAPPLPAADQLSPEETRAMHIKSLQERGVATSKDAFTTHSFGVRTNPRKGDLARRLLGMAAAGDDDDKRLELVFETAVGKRVRMTTERLIFETGLCEEHVISGLVDLAERGVIHQTGADEYEFARGHGEQRNDNVVEISLLLMSLLDLFNLRGEQLLQPDDDLVRLADGLLPHHAGIRAKLPGERPLIDKLHAATFEEPVGLQWAVDKRRLREYVRRAHCFSLDAASSALVADFSLAVARDLDAARRLAIPPFPVTWFEIDNLARLTRIKQLGVELTQNAKFDPVPRNGWLITPGSAHFDYCATYFCEAQQGMVMSPLSYSWRVGEPTAENLYAQLPISTGNQLCFGLSDTDVNPRDASIFPPPFGRAVPEIISLNSMASAQEVGLLVELSGELRHVFGTLIALGAGHLGAEIAMTPRPLYEGPRQMAKGKELLPLEHKTLTIKLSKRTSAKVVTAKAIFHARKRWHEVRGHWREYKNPDGTVRKRVPVKAHERGEKRLGVITKTYKVER